MVCRDGGSKWCGPNFCTFLRISKLPFFCTYLKILDVLKKMADGDGSKWSVEMIGRNDWSKGGVEMMGPNFEEKWWVQMMSRNGVDRISVRF